ncbi:MAG: excinuclease ABC subunit UvrC [Firmicutes bacterium]|nr:excinuclease ABC subunit UvrC [Bacillota bacterium]
MSDERQAARLPLLEKIKQFPTLPGVYLMKDRAGRVIYVGKARNLRARVNSYFRRNIGARQQLLVSRIEEIDYILTSTEMEALITENQIIKEYQPRYNISLKDDKSYPYARITPELYPRLEMVRLPLEDEKRHGAYEPIYFGPYTEARALRRTLRFLDKIFPLRSCRQDLDGTERGRPCLNYQMKRCLGPCRGNEAVPPEEYRALVNQVILFMEGKQGDLLGRIEAQMHDAAARLDFETAMVHRDRLHDLRRALDNQKVLALPSGDYDILALINMEEAAGAEPASTISVYMFRIREGRMKEREHFVLKGAGGMPEAEIMGGFIKNYYSRGVLLPAEIIVSHRPDDMELLEQWLHRIYDLKVKIVLPRRGFRRDLLERCVHEGYLLAREKARKGVRPEREEERRRSLAALGKIVQRENLSRLEGYDISHLQGGGAVGSMVVFQEGAPFKNGYRRFRLRGEYGGDDCRSLREVLRRRMEHGEMPRPDLIMVDGGAAQLNVLTGILREKGWGDVSAIALAEKKEEIYLPEEKEPLHLPLQNPAVNLLRKIRDEAHRFALAYHRRVRGKEALLSSLDRIPGIGKKRKAELLRHFGGMGALLKASPEEIRRVKGFGKELSRAVYDFLHRQ